MCVCVCREFVKAFIDFPKPLIAVINGPAVGVSVTLLGLFEIVYATERVRCFVMSTQCWLRTHLYRPSIYVC